MNDVLAKPFTKDGMVRILKKHLVYLLKNPPQEDELLQQGGMPGPSVSSTGYTSAAGMAGIGHLGGPSSMGGSSGSVKFETTPIQSPSTTASWHSPAQMTHASPNMDGANYMAAGGAAPMVMTPGGTQRGNFSTGPPPPMSNPPIRAVPEAMAEDRPEKRQRLYGPAGVQYQ